MNLVTSDKAKGNFPDLNGTRGFLQKVIAAVNGLNEFNNSNQRKAVVDTLVKIARQLLFKLFFIGVDAIDNDRVEQVMRWLNEILKTCQRVQKTETNSENLEAAWIEINDRVEILSKYYDELVQEELIETEEQNKHTLNRYNIVIIVLLMEMC